MNEVVSVPLVFAMGFVTEWVYVGFVGATVARRPLAAALWCALLVALGWAALAFMIQLTWFLCLPALAGHSVGTYLAVRRVAQQD